MAAEPSLAAARPVAFAPVFSNLPPPRVSSAASSQAASPAVLGMFGYSTTARPRSSCARCMRLSGPTAPVLRLIGSPGPDSPTGEAWRASAASWVSPSACRSPAFWTPAALGRARGRRPAAVRRPAGPHSRKGTLAAVTRLGQRGARSRRALDVGGAARRGARGSSRARTPLWRRRSRACSATTPAARSWQPEAGASPKPRWACPARPAPCENCSVALTAGARRTPPRASRPTGGSAGRRRDGSRGPSLPPRPSRGIGGADRGEMARERVTRGYVSRPASPIARRRGSSSSSCPSASASEPAFPAGTVRPETPSSSHSGIPPVALPTAGRPAAKPSIPTSPNGSGQSEGQLRPRPARTRGQAPPFPATRGTRPGRRCRASSRATAASRPGPPRRTRRAGVETRDRAQQRLDALRRDEAPGEKDPPALLASAAARRVEGREVRDDAPRRDSRGAQVSIHRVGVGDRRVGLVEHPQGASRPPKSSG